MDLKKLTGKKLKSFECWQQISLNRLKQNPYFKKRLRLLKDGKICSDTFKYNFDSLDIELKYER